MNYEEYKKSVGRISTAYEKYKQAVGRTTTSTINPVVSTLKNASVIQTANEIESPATRNTVVNNESFKSTIPVSGTAVKLQMGNNTNKFYTGLNPGYQEAKDVLQEKAYEQIKNSNAVKDLNTYVQAEKEFQNTLPETEEDKYLEYKSKAQQTEDMVEKAKYNVMAEKSKQHGDLYYGTTQTLKTIGTGIADSFVNAGQFVKNAFKSEMQKEIRDAWESIATFSSPDYKSKFKALRDVSDEQANKVAQNAINSAKQVLRKYNITVPDNVNAEYALQMIADIDEWVYKENKLEEATRTAHEKVQQENQALGPIGKTITQTADVVSQMVPTIVTNTVLPGAGSASMFLSSAQSSSEEALKEGATYEQAIQRGILSGAMEVGTEMIGGENLSKLTGIPTLFKKFGINTPNKLVQVLIDVGSEGLEEMVSTGVQPLIDRATYNPNAKFATANDYWQSFKDSILPTLFFVGVNESVTAVNNYKAKAIQKIEQSNMTNEQKEQAKVEIEKGAQEMIQQLNSQTTPQNSTNLEETSPNTVQIEQNNVQNALDLQKTVQSEQSLGVKQSKEIPQAIQTFIENRNKTAPGLNIQFDNTLNTDGRIIRKSDGTRVISINPNSTRAYEFVVVHEMMHDLENTQEFQELYKYVKDRAITQEGFEKAKQAITEQYTKYYTENNLDMSGLNMDVETTNDMVAQALGNQQFLNELAGNKPNVFMRLYNWIKNVAFDGNKTGKTFVERRADNKYLQELKNKFETAYNTVYNSSNTQNNYSIAGQKGLQNAINTDSRFKRLEDNLKRAQIMAQNNIDNEQIRRNTNWFQDKNGDWKFEFSDKDMSLKNDIILEENKNYKLENILEHDILFLMYPELRDYNIKFVERKNTNQKGKHDAKTRTISINSKLMNLNGWQELIEGTIVHELQHAIQNIEGFEKGKSSFSKTAYYNSLGEIEADDVKNRFLLEKYHNKKVGNIQPESSKANPIHRRASNLNNLTTIDKMKDKIYNSFEKYMKGKNDLYEETIQKNSGKDIQFNKRTDDVGRHIEGLEDSSSFSLGKNLPKTDNQGRKLTKGQQAYFKESKIRDENGNLKVMYHGTPNGDFTIFRDGAYFTDDKEYADIYQHEGASSISTGKVATNPKTFEVYLNIKKPFDINDAEARNIYINEYIKGGNAAGINPYLSDAEYDKIKTVDWVEGEDLRDFLIENGYDYDGLILDEGGVGGFGEGVKNRGLSYVVFNSNQIKNVDNTNPTDDPDTRYSQSNNEWQKYLDKNWDLMPNANKTTSLMPSTEQLKAQDLKQGEEAYNTLNMKKPKLEDIATVTEEQANLPTMSYKQKADKNTPYRRKFWDNVESSKIISKDVKEQVNMTNYERKHNADVLEKMKERLDAEPMKVAQEWFRKDIKKATDQDVALGAILMERYQAEGRFDEAVDVVEKLADMGTEAGRTVQMYSIFQRLTPEGMMIYQQRKLNSALETLTQKQTGKWVEQNKDKFKLTEDDATFITAKVQEAQNAPTERQKQIALAEIETRINDKLPPEAGQSVKAFRRIAMLFNPKTQVRNVAGNVTVMPLNYVTDLVATGIDKAIAKKTGVRTTALPNVKTIGKGFKKGAAETIDDYKRGIRTTPTGSRYEIQNNAKSFNENTNSKVKNAINKKMNAIDRILSTTLELGDRPFYEAAYQNALEGQMKANKVTEPTQEMIDIASNVALSQTWQDNNNYTQAVLGIRSAFNKININGFGLGDLIIPFAKTPANLTKAMVDYSPAGFIPAIINYNDMRKAISRGDMTAMQQKKFVTSVGKAMAGTILYAIAGALVKGGKVTGSSDEDKDVANFEKNVLGIQPYSIKIGDKTFTYNWANPIATPFAIMADTYKMSEEGAKWNEILVNAFKVAGDQLVANSFLQGIQELLSSEYSNESAMDNLVGALMDLPTQFTPTLFGQIATQFDSTKRQTFENGDTVGTMINEVKNKLPGARNTLAPQVNTFGEEIQNYGGDNNPFNVFLNPGNISSTNATDTQKELYALYEVTKDKTIFPRQAPYSVSGGGEKVTLSSQDRAEYQKESGQYVTENLDALFDSEFYKTLEDNRKVDVIAKIVSDADTTAKDKWIDTEATENLSELKAELKASGIPLLDYYNAWIATRGIESDKNWKGETITNSKSKKQKEAIDKATPNLDKWERRTLYEIFNVGKSVW